MLRDLSLEVMTTNPTQAASTHKEHATSQSAHELSRLVARTVEIPARGTNLTALIDLLPATAPLAWVRRGEGIVGWGEVARLEFTGADRFDEAISAWNHIREHVIIRDEVKLPGTGAVAFGTFGFSYATKNPSVLIIPQVVVGRRGDTWWLTTITTADEPFAHQMNLDDLAQDLEPVSIPGAVAFSAGSRSEDEWKGVVARGIELIKAGQLDKIVLARDVVGRTDNPIDVRHLLGNLAVAYQNCWTFSVDTMVGATPELLVRTEKGLVTSRVLAGTIQRTGDDETDTAHAAILAHSSKDLEEHEYAVRSVADALRPYCSSLNVPETPFVLHLPNVLHLASDVAAVVDSSAGATSLSLAKALHPTAAVCGTPTVEAAQTILEIEGMDRSRYAGPVGWLGADGDGEWGIGLRSAELSATDPHQIRLFAGCGIVAASDPASELAETFAKLRPMQSALGERVAAE